MSLKKVTESHYLVQKKSNDFGIKKIVSDIFKFRNFE